MGKSLKKPKKGKVIIVPWIISLIWTGIAFWILSKVWPNDTPPTPSLTLTGIACTIVYPLIWQIYGIYQTKDNDESQEGHQKAVIEVLAEANELKYDSVDLALRTAYEHDDPRLISRGTFSFSADLRKLTIEIQIDRNYLAETSISDRSVKKLVIKISELSFDKPGSPQTGILEIKYPDGKWPEDGDTFRIHYTIHAALHPHRWAEYKVISDPSGLQKYSLGFTGLKGPMN